MKTLICADQVVSGRGTIGDAVLVEDGAIAAVGFRRDLDTGEAAETTYPGMTILAGLRDAHMHPVPYAALLDGCSLKNATDISDLQDRITEFAATLDDVQPIVATRLDDESLAERRLPTRHDLDAAVSDRPVVLYRYCGHVTVANTLALERSGITSATPDPEGGMIDRDAGGNPTGVLRETAAGLLSSALSRGGDLEDETLLGALTGLAGLGITSIGAMIGYGDRPFEQLDAEIDLWLRVADRLPIKVHCFAITGTPANLQASAERLNAGGPRLRWAGVKRFADGSFGGHTAALVTPFTDVDTTGAYRLTPSDVAVSKASIALGGSVAIHAIGDRAVDGVLDAFDELVHSGAEPSALRMEHASLLRPDQITRFAASGFTAVVQPAFMASESGWIQQRVGPERSSWLYPFRSMLESGIPLAGSSDCPVEPPHPLWGIASAMHRHGITAAEKLTGAEALDLFTSGAARSLGEPEPLAMGSPADLVIVDTNVATADASDVFTAKVVETYVDGVAVEVDRSVSVWPDLDQTERV